MTLADTRRKWTAFLLALWIVLWGFPVSSAQDVTASARIECDSMVKQGSVYYLSGGTAAHGAYTLQNISGEPLLLVELRETIGPNRHTLSLGGQELAPGGTIDIAGASFTAPGAGKYPLSATLVYQKNGAEQTAALADLSAETIHIGWTVSYQILTPDVMYAGETYTATYRASVTSNSNVRLENVQPYHVSDTGDRMALGNAASLPPGQGGLWEKAVTASYQQDQGGYLAVQYTDPVTGLLSTAAFTDKRVNIDLSAGTAKYVLALEGSSDPEYLSEEGPIKITIRARNDGNASLVGVEVKDWTGRTVLTAQKLKPGESVEKELHSTASPGDEGMFTGTATVEGTAQGVVAQWHCRVPEGLKLDVQRTLIPSVPTVGEPFAIRYAVTNRGSRSLIDIVILEPELGTSVRIDSLEPGQTQTVDMAATLTEDAVSAPEITAVDRETHVQLATTLPAMPITLAMPNAESLLGVALTTQPLDEESVSVACTLTNIGGMDLKNIEVRLLQREIVLGSILTLAPGDTGTLTYDKLVIGELTEITARADAVLPNGDVITVMSDPVALAGPEEPTASPEATPGTEEERTGRSILLPVLIAVIVLGLGALAVIFWPVKKDAHSKKRGDAEGGDTP